MDHQEIKNVVNLSSFTLQPQHISLPERGLKFCPSPGQPNLGELREDMDRLHKRLRQIAFFENPESYYETPVIDNNSQVSTDFKSEPFENQKFKPKSNFKGCQTSPNLEAFIIANENDFNSKIPSNKFCRRNITHTENQALKELMNNNDIIIRPADKGSAVVIINRSDYLKEGFKQLSNTNFYKHTEVNCTNEFENEINNFIEDMYQNGEIGEKCKD